MCDKIKCLIGFYNNTAERLKFLPEFISRIVVGFIFIQSGWGKLHHLDKVVGFFESLGIPAPQIQAPFVATVELIGGLMILLGIGTRFAAAPLVVIMAVALKTAKWAELENASDIFGLSEFLYGVILLWLFAFGDL
jgi:putative oxidoreductase